MSWVLWAFFTFNGWSLTYPLGNYGSSVQCELAALDTAHAYYANPVKVDPIPIIQLKCISTTKL